MQPPDPHLTGRGALGLSISLAGGPGGGLGASPPALGVVMQMEKLASGPGINKAGKEVARWKLHEVGTGISKGPAELRSDGVCLCISPSSGNMLSLLPCILFPPF